jgi:N-carbamoyl-L-amino-acid hydrolase
MILTLILVALIPVPAGPPIQRDRLRATLEELSKFGRNPEGGVSRIAFSEPDRASREYVMRLMREAGLTVRVDAAGNIYGRREGTEPRLPVILFGSHTDSVPHGGNFDGDVGSMGAIEVIRAMNGAGLRTRHPLEVVIWTNEEGHHYGKPLFGSRASAGLLDAGELDRKDEEGVTLAEWLRRYGQDPARIGEAQRRAGEVSTYFELHIEQGGRLEREKKQIGVVEGIVGIRRWMCVAQGMANHAGTTPMDERRDALLAASRAALLLRQEVRAESGGQVGTVGYVHAEPGARNIVPGRAEFPLEIRDLSPVKINRIADRVFAGLKVIEQEERVKIDCQPLSQDTPALTDTTMRRIVEQSASEAGFSTMTMPSGAGHDAQAVANYAPMGMIFIPSIGGVSHAPNERSDWQDIANGAEVLYRAIVKRDAETGGGAFRVGGGVTPPMVIHRVEPEFTRDAEKAKVDGTVLISVVVDAEGNVRDPKVVKPIGFGLDETALAAVKQWKFKPGTKDGQPVPVYMQVEFTFRLR